MSLIRQIGGGAALMLKSRVQYPTRNDFLPVAKGEDTSKPNVLSAHHERELCKKHNYEINQGYERDVIPEPGRLTPSLG